jgi:putative sigma-54 modulation protein
MELTIRGADITVSDDLRAFAQSRVDRLDRYIEHVVEAKLELKPSRRRNNNNAVVAQLTLQTGRDILRAEEQDQDVRKAIGLAVNKLEVQARRVSERRSSRKRSGQALGEHLAPESLPVDIPAFDAEDAEEIGTVVRVKRFALKPMDVDEAIEQMELLGHDFFLFQNREEDGVNVLYRRKDGTFGLLAPLTT